VSWVRQEESAPSPPLASGRAAFALQQIRRSSFVRRLGQSAGGSRGIRVGGFIVRAFRPSKIAPLDGDTEDSIDEVVKITQRGPCFPVTDSQMSFSVPL